MIRNLQALATFIRVAEHLSFTEASKELNLSQGAVSVQIRQLEEELGFKLFERKIRQIQLTWNGERLLKTVQPAFRQILTQIEVIRSAEGSGRLSVSTLPSFATKWLIPRIADFHNKHSRLSIRIHTSNSIVDFLDDQIDCSIRFGLGVYPGLNVTPLMEEVYFPVCSPDLIKQDLPLKDPELIKNYPILHDIKTFKGSNINWLHWATQMGVEHLDFNRGLQFNQADFAVQAAIAGQGIVLGRQSLVEGDLQAGLLVPVFEKVIQSNFSYFFVHPVEYSDKPDIALFKQWLIDQIAEK